MDELVAFELLKPAAAKEEVGVMKKDPTELELEVVTFQAVEVSVVMSQVITERVLGKEVESAMYANPKNLLVQPSARGVFGEENYHPKSRTRRASPRCSFRTRRR